MKKEKHYYIRDEENKPIITVCLLGNHGAINRGIAICSAEDQACKKVGQIIARIRALTAALLKKNSLEINRKDIPLIAFEFGFYKSYYNPELTKFEQKLFKINNKNDKTKKEKRKKTMNKFDRIKDWKEFGSIMEKYIETPQTKYGTNLKFNDLCHYTGLRVMLWNILKYALRLWSGAGKENDFQKIAHYAQMGVYLKGTARKKGSFL
jgi:hypothetical protein